MASAAEPVAQVRVAFDRNGVVSTRAEGMADLATGRKDAQDEHAQGRAAGKGFAVVAAEVLDDEARDAVQQDVAPEGAPGKRPPTP